jgi:hypothetical protein
VVRWVHSVVVRRTSLTSVSMALSVDIRQLQADAERDGIAKLVVGAVMHVAAVPSSCAARSTMRSWPVLSICRDGFELRREST